LMQRSMGGQHLPWTGWWLQTPLDQCLVWNRCRQRCVPEAVIRAMHLSLNSPPHRPDLSEGFASLIRLNHAGSQLSDQINRALQTILDPLP
jgi:predicted kinase